MKSIDKDETSLDIFPWFHSRDWKKANIRPMLQEKRLNFQNFKMVMVDLQLQQTDG
jgi:hypothetical protein